jgi:hypothetical protein
METYTLSDPVRYAEAIRSLALEAHKLRQSPSTAALWGLSGRIDTLACVLGDRRDGPLGTWLDNLGREVRSAALRRSRSCRPVCVGA